jgi:hypothetical protein
MAVWHNNKRYPAQITKVLEPGKRFYTLHKILSIQDFVISYFKETLRLFFMMDSACKLKLNKCQGCPKNRLIKWYLILQYSKIIM